MSGFTVAEGQKVIDTVMVPWLDDLKMTVEGGYSETIPGLKMVV